MQQIVSGERLHYTLLSRLCAIILQTIPDGDHVVQASSFIAMSYHAPYNNSSDHAQRLTHIEHFHRLCYRLSQHYRLPVIIGADYNLDI
ncbi:unnamed protein product, partial [Rotaria magnacalcarata]